MYTEVYETTALDGRDSVNAFHRACVVQVQIGSPASEVPGYCLSHVGVVAVKVRVTSK